MIDRWDDEEPEFWELAISKYLRTMRMIWMSHPEQLRRLSIDMAAFPNPDFSMTVEVTRQAILDFYRVPWGALL